MNLHKNRNIIFPLLLILTLGNLRTDAQDLANFNSAFTDIGMGARPLGMGQAYSALAADANAILWNPAGIIEVKKFEGTFSYTRLYDLVPYSFASLVYTFSPNFSLAEGVIISGDDLLNELTLTTCLATRFYLSNYKINLGITFNLYSASFGKTDEIETNVSGSALGYSLGWGTQVFLSQKIIIACHFKNILNQINWNSSTLGNYEEGLPQNWIIGIGFKNFYSLNFDFDFHKSLFQDIEDKFYIGAERIFFSKIFLRSGTGSSINQSQPLFYTFGFGINHVITNQLNFQIDGAYIIHPLENMFRISLSIGAK
ncbi:MAG: hypothetical protein SCK70_07300 [bacterium]|nr:hypothetical protein [bacterium]